MNSSSLITSLDKVLALRKAKGNRGLEGRLAGPGVDIDIALCEFQDYFRVWLNIKFSFPFKLITELELLGSLDQLEDKGLRGTYIIQGWRGTYVIHKVPKANNLLSGFIYGKKETEEGLVEYGAAGFIHFNGKKDISINGTLYGQDREKLGKFYETMLELFTSKFDKVKRLRPVKEYPWQREY
jgi:hypothetical protein